MYEIKSNDDLCKPWTYQLCNDDLCTSTFTKSGVSLDIEEGNTITPSTSEGLPMIILKVE